MKRDSRFEPVPLPRVHQTGADSSAPAAAEMKTPPRCVACGFAGADVREAIRALLPAVCSECMRRYPHTLLRATVGPYLYALRLSTGETIRFTKARIHGQYVHLTLDAANKGRGHPVDNTYTDDAVPFVFDFPSGIEVHADLITWCCESPFSKAQLEEQPSK